jgi:ergothioneine biosynthesis protein EgtB
MELEKSTEAKSDTAASRQLKTRYFSIRQKTKELCYPLLAEDYAAQPIIDVSPPKWHLAHSTWFFENFILLAENPAYKAFNTGYLFLFNSYYESVGERLNRAERGTLTRPPVEEIYEYRLYVDEAMGALFESLSIEMPEKIKNLIELGLQHEQQHQELLITDIKYILGNNPLFPAYIEHAVVSDQSIAEHPHENYIEIPEGIYEIGHNGSGFCFDNELNRHKVYLQSFNVMDRLITNQEYLEFMDAGGYQDFKYWLQEGWQWVKENQICAPHYWQKTGQEWYNYTLKGLQKVNLFEPVTHISYYEADAFARWKGKRLLTEFEWEAAAQILYSEVPEHSNFLEEGNLHPIIRNNFSSQMFGDAWEWCCSAYLPYPGFKTDEGAIGEYNGKFMINQMVLKGGSCATPKSHIRHSYRNFFHPDKRWQFTGIRLANNLK